MPARRVDLAALLDAALLGRSGVQKRRSRFSEANAYWVDGHEFLHFHDDGAVDVRLTRACIRAHRGVLETDPAVVRRSPSSDWVEYVVSKGTPEIAVRLATLAWEANRDTRSPSRRPPPRREGIVSRTRKR